MQKRQEYKVAEVQRFLFAHWNTLMFGWAPLVAERVGEGKGHRNIYPEINKRSSRAKKKVTPFLFEGGQINHYYRLVDQRPRQPMGMPAGASTRKRDELDEQVSPRSELDQFRGARQRPRTPRPEPAAAGTAIISEGVPVANGATFQCTMGNRPRTPRPEPAAAGTANVSEGVPTVANGATFK